tara:strand:+ start:1003 stop:1923 length:921 start_codon:yes stop_codon:yes gene_type:complete
MKSTNKTIFTTQWDNDNVLIESSGGGFSRYFLSIFFKNWLLLKPKKTEYNVILKYSNDEKRDSIKASLFNYTREIKENQITTLIYKPQILRAIVRSLYKFTNKHASVVGVSELYMAIIRRSIIEPIEYVNYLKGWKMVHASVFRLNNKLYVVSAGSKVGKSTLVSKLRNEYNCEVLSDNYCFVRGNKVRTIEEPLRGGLPSRYKLSFYKRTINGYPTSFEGEINHFIIMNRGGQNRLLKIDFEDLNFIVNKTNNQEKEGICFLEEVDPIRILKNEIKIGGNFSAYKLEVAEGLNNLNTSINLINKI